MKATVKAQALKHLANAQRELWKATAYLALAGPNEVRIEVARRLVNDCTNRLEAAEVTP